MTRASIHQPALPFGEGPLQILGAYRRWGIAAGHSDRTIIERGKTVERIAREYDLLEVRPEDLVDWMSRLTNPRTGERATKSTKQTYRAHLRSFFRWLHATGRRGDNPADHLPSLRPPRGLPRPFSPTDVERILEACADPRAHQTRLYVLLGAYAGLRNHEIAKVRGEDFIAGVVRVTGKGGVTLDVPMHGSLLEAAQRMPAHGPWFPSEAGSGHVSRMSVGNAITRAIQRAGLNGTPHQLRHHFGTQVLRSSRGDLRLTQRALRHASPTTTALYTLVADENLAWAIQGINSGPSSLAA